MNKIKVAICVSGLKNDIIYNDAKKTLIDNIILNNNISTYEIFEYYDDSFNHDYDKYLKYNGGATGVRINTILPMFYKILKCNELKKIYEKKNEIIFDIVIRSRFDLFLLEKIDLQKININKVNFLNYGGLSKNKELISICDFFALSNSKNLDIYSECFNNLEQLFLDNNIKFKNPEILQLANLKNNNVDIDLININHFVKRLNG